MNVKIMLLSIVLLMVLVYLWRFFLNTHKRPKWFPFEIFYPICRLERRITQVVWYNRYIKQWRWNKRTDHKAMPIQNWSYNGFGGELLDGLASFTGEFIAWTSDPGVALIKCSDGENRRIPSYAIPGHMPPQPNYEKMKKHGKMYYFGHASSSEN